MSRQFFFCCTLVIALVVVCNETAFGWMGSTHSKLCHKTFDDPVVVSLVAGWPSSAVNAIQDWGGEPADNWHTQQWSDIRDRAYVDGAGSPNGNDWSTLPGDITRMQLLTHNCTDVGVPIGHNPANLYDANFGGAGYTDFWTENFLELHVTTWDNFPSVVGTTIVENGALGTSYDLDGTIDQVVEKFYAAARENMVYYRDGGNRDQAAWQGINLALILQRAVLVDFILSQHGTIADLDNDILVFQGGTAHFDASQSYDPDDIVWHSNATYSHTDDYLEEYCWDFNCDGTWDWVDDDPYVDRTYDQLRACGVPTNRWVTYGLRVKDDEGNYGYDSDWIFLSSDGTVIVPEPATMSLLTVGGLALLRRRR